MKNNRPAYRVIFAIFTRLWSILICVLFILCACQINAQEDSLKQSWFGVSGYVKDLQGISFTDDIGDFNSINLLHNRLNFRIQASDKFTAKLEIRNRVFYGDLVKSSPGFGQLIDQYNGYTRLSRLWLNEAPIVMHSVLDRAFVQYETEKWNIRFGRQRINWGIANIWNPNDIFNAYNFLDFDYEERPGNDALRIRRGIGDGQSLELAYKPGKKKDESIAAVMYRFNRWKYDIQVLGGLYYSDVVLGLGWAGSIGDTGFKGEYSSFYPRYRSRGEKASYAFTLMADRTFPRQWYVSLAFLYNQAADRSTWTGGTIFYSNITAKNIFPYPYSFYTVVMKTFSPLTSLNFSVIYAPKNQNLILLPSFVWSVATDIDFDITLQSFYGRVGQVYRNEGNGLYIRWKWSF